MALKIQAIIAIALLSAFAIALPATGLGGHPVGGNPVGGRTKIQDVETNKEIQDLGKYSVDQYNLQQHGSDHKGIGNLKFLKVVAAEKQVVAGIKYYLTIAAATTKGKKKTFDAEVVVQEWKKSKQLLNFAPSPVN